MARHAFFVTSSFPSRALSPPASSSGAQSDLIATYTVQNVVDQLLMDARVQQKMTHIADFLAAAKIT